MTPVNQTVSFLASRLASSGATAQMGRRLAVRWFPPRIIAADGTFKIYVGDECVNAVAIDETSF